MQKPLIEFEDLTKLEIKLGTIISVENVIKSEKLLKLKVDFGGNDIRTIFTGMAKWYKPEELTGLQTIFLTNIKPRKMMGEESQGMILALDVPDDGKPMFLKPLEPSENGYTLL